jgi:hypothetical protein
MHALAYIHHLATQKPMLRIKEPIPFSSGITGPFDDGLDHDFCHSAPPIEQAA